MRVLTVFTQPVENNTSSMIRCRNVINGIASIGHDVVAYSPYPDQESIYYGKSFDIERNVIIRRYGPTRRGTTGRKKDNRFRNFLLAIYRKFDLFGAAIVNLKYINEIESRIENEHYDLLISFSGPIVSHILSNKIHKRRKDLKYVQQWGDPLTADITRKSWTPKWVQKKIEGRILREADKVFYVSPLTYEEQRHLFHKEKNKMEFVPTPANVRIYEEVVNSRLKVGYFGAYHTSARNIRPLYEAALRINGLDLLIVGDSDIKLQEAGNVSLLNRITPEEVEKYMSEMDVIVCLMNSKGGQIPGKTYNYACTNKEVLMILDGDRSDDIENFFKQYERFTFVNNNISDIEKVLRQYLNAGVPKRMPVKEFTPELIAERMVGI